MKIIVAGIFFLLFIGLAFSQENIANQKEFNIAQIEQKAKADAKVDFKTKKVKWFYGSALSGCLPLVGLVAEKYPLVTLPFFTAPIFPTVIALKTEVLLPDQREKMINIRSEQYQAVYRAKYKSVTRKKRLFYTITGPPIGCGTGLAILMFATLIYYMTPGAT